MKNKIFLFVSIVALLAVLLSACAGVVTEETPGQTANTQPAASTEAAPVATKNGQDGPRREGRERNLEAAAEALGVTVEELQAAFQAAVPAECASTDGQPNRDTNCRADMNLVAETLGVTVEEVQAVLGGNKQGARGERDLTHAAETLGVTVEELQAAFQAAVPAECASTDGQPNRDSNCRVDLSVVADTLGVTVEELQAVIGSRGLDFSTAAETLGVTEEELRAALEASRPSECASTDSQPVEESKKCRPDFTIAAETLGVTVEDLQAAIGKSSRGGQGRGPGGTGGQNGGEPPAVSPTP